MTAYPEPAKRAYAIPAASVEREAVEWLWAGRIPIGNVSLLVGDPGLGKSLLTCELAARVSREGGYARLQPVKTHWRQRCGHGWKLRRPTSSAWPSSRCRRMTATQRGCSFLTT
jgi:hypothetical protein